MINIKVYIKSIKGKKTDDKMQNINTSIESSKSFKNLDLSKIKHVIM